MLVCLHEFGKVDTCVCVYVYIYMYLLLINIHIKKHMYTPAYHGSPRKRREHHRNKCTSMYGRWLGIAGVGGEGSWAKDTSGTEPHQGASKKFDQKPAEASLQVPSELKLQVSKEIGGLGFRVAVLAS